MGSLLNLSPYAIAFVGGVIAGHYAPGLYTVIMGWFQGAASSTAASDVATVATVVTDVVGAVEGATGTTPAAPASTTTATK